MKKYGIIVYNTGPISTVLQSLQLDFKLTHCQSFESLLEHASSNRDALVLIDVLSSDELQFEILTRILNQHKEIFVDLSVVLILDQISVDKRLNVCELGADDCIESQITHDNLVARIQSTIFNSIANKQLKDKFNIGSDVAVEVMSKTDDIGVTIQFFLDSFQCGNLDQLGQLLFKVLNYYGLSCSLQMRSKFYVKNMEANGMERAMESRLLSEMHSCGSVYEFGQRAVINEGRVSLLIKNMPVEQSEKKPIIYYTVITLLKGVNARLQSLDKNLAALGEQEKRHDLEQGAEWKQEAADDSCYPHVANEVSDFLDELLVSMDSSEQELSLNDQQESVLVGLLKKGRNKVMSEIESERLAGKNSN